MAENAARRDPDPELKKILEESAKIGEEIDKLLLKRGILLAKGDARLKKLGIR